MTDRCPFIHLIFVVRFTAFVLSWLFGWNVVLGGSVALVLCFHQQGDAHLDVVAKDVSDVEKTATRETQTDALGPHHSSSCDDFVFESTELTAQPLNKLTGPDAPQWVAAIPLCSTELRAPAPKAAFAAATPTRGPPAAEPICELIRRTSVLRL